MERSVTLCYYNNTNKGLKARYVKAQGAAQRNPVLNEAMIIKGLKARYVKAQGGTQ
ncbi:MAG: hypothetical protein U9R19_01165 [Bacteroidota bacterium]|nr:hypothetical protein [Bacteroidota bacterium]